MKKWRSVKQQLKKKRFLFPLIFLGWIAIVSIIANVFGLETENTMFGGISVLVMFSTCIWFLIKTIKDHKAKLATVRIPFYGVTVLTGLYFITALLTFLVLLHTVLLITGVVP